MANPVYEINNPTAEQITNLYLYGTIEPPVDGIRQPNIGNPTVKIDINEYMDNGPGRFASAADIRTVERFMNGFDNPYNSDPLPPGRYSKPELLKHDAFRDFEGNITKVYHTGHDDGKDNFLERAYLWNTTAFYIDDRAEFVIEPNGNRHIENFALVPYVNKGHKENFDFEGGDWIAGVVNPYLKGKIDPQNIGQTVNFEFIGKRQTITYDMDAHNQAVAKTMHPDNKIHPELLPEGLAKIKGYTEGLVESNNIQMQRTPDTASQHADILRDARNDAYQKEIQAPYDYKEGRQGFSEEAKQSAQRSKAYAEQSHKVQSVTDALDLGRNDNAQREQNSHRYNGAPDHYTPPLYLNDLPQGQVNPRLRSDASDILAPVATVALAEAVDPRFTANFDKILTEMRDDPDVMAHLNAKGLSDPDSMNSIASHAAKQGFANGAHPVDGVVMMDDGQMTVVYQNPGKIYQDDYTINMAQAATIDPKVSEQTAELALDNHTQEFAAMVAQYQIPGGMSHGMSLGSPGGDAGGGDGGGGGGAG